MRLLTVEDHPLFARALHDEIVRLLPAVPHIDVVGSSEAALRAAASAQYDLTFVDLKVPGASGLTLVRTLKQKFGARVAVVTANEDPSMVRAIFSERAVGYLWKAAPAEQFREALYLLLAGAAVFPDYVYSRSLSDQSANSLTDRELGVLGLLVTGMQNKEVARELDVSVPTVKTHIKNIFAKLGVKTRLAAVYKARELGLFTDRMSQ